MNRSLKGGKILQISILNRNIKNIENIEFVEEDNKYYINLSMIIETESSVDRCKAKLELPNIDTIKISRGMCGYGTFMDLGFGDLRCVDDKVEYENIRKKEREMTLSDIERKLGYKIKLVSEKE